MDILYWREITNFDNILRPVIFFQPSLDFLTFLKNHGRLNVPIQISGTDFYDGTYIVNIDTRTDLVQCFQYNKPQVLVLSAVLDRDFTVIPPNKGNINLYIPSNNTSSDIMSIENAISENVDNSSIDKTSSIDNYSSMINSSSEIPCKKSSLYLWQIILFLLLILLIVYICFIYFKK